MGLLAEYKLSYQHLPLVDVAEAVPELTLELDVGQPNQGSHPPFVLTATGAAIERLERELDRSAFVAAYSLITRTREQHRYHVLPAASMEDQLADRVDDFETLEALAATGSIVERITVEPDGWVQKRWFADRDAFLAYCQFWRENGTSFSLIRLSRVDRDDPLSPTLTDCQREALLTALEMGYFDVPRTATLDEIGDELGVSAPAVSERLRRAHATLIEQFVSPSGINGFTS